MLDIIEQNIILYYADYLALRNASRQVTDNCKYYCLYGAPVNVAYLHNSSPFYDTEDQYYIQAYTELQTILQKAGIEAVKDYVMSICNLKVMGCVDAKLMLKQVHQFSNSFERNVAFGDYQKWLST